MKLITLEDLIGHPPDVLDAAEKGAIETVEAFCGCEIPLPLPNEVRAVVAEQTRINLRMGQTTRLVLWSRVMLQSWRVPPPPI